MILFGEYNPIEPFNKNARFLLNDNDHVKKDFSVKFVLNYLLVCSKSPMEHYNIEQHVQRINIYFQNQCSI